MSRIRRRRRNRRIAIRVVVGLVGLYLLAGFLVAPRVLKAQVESRLTALLGRATTVERVRTNPLTLSVTLSGFSIKEPDGTAEFAGWDRLYVNAGLWGSFLRHWRVQEITLEGFRAAASVRADGSLNVSDLLERFTGGAGDGPATEPAPARPLHVGVVTITRAQLSIEDLSTAEPFRSVVGPMDFVLTDLHTGGGVDAPYRFAAVTESGERVAWEGTLHAKPFRSAGTLEVGSIVLGKYAPYSAPWTQADVRSGTLSVGGRYEIDLTEGARVLRLADGSVSVRQVDVVERASGRPVVALPAVDVTGINVDAMTRVARVAQVKVEGGKASVRRDVDGSLNLQRLLSPPATDRPSSAGVPAGGGDTPAFSVEVAEVAVTGFAADWTDLAAPWPAQLGIADLGVTVRNLSNAPDATMPVSVSLRWLPEGTVTVDGEVTILPSLRAALTTRVTGLSLVPLGPYMEGVARARIARGLFATEHVLRAAMKDGAVDWSFAGGVTLDDLAIEDTGQGDEVAALTRLEISGIQANPTSVFVEQVSLSGPKVRAVLAADGTLNLAALRKADDAAASAPAGPADPAPAPPSAGEAPALTVHRVAVNGGEFSLTDRSVQPEVRLALQDFGGTVVGLSSENFARAQVALKGSVDGVGPVSVAGRLDPLGPKPFVDLEVDFQNIDLVSFSPYSAKYAGFTVARGKLRVDVDFALDGTQLDAGNVITLDQFNFGAPSNSPEATKLPVRLAVALLKDTEGKIVIDVPVKGRTDDPEFKVGRVVLRVIVNLLTKAAVSPFALLGSMFGGGGEELAFQEFAPGTVQLLESEKAKLATLEKALKERPGLNLMIEGSIDPVRDAETLRQLRFERQIRDRFVTDGISWPADEPIDPEEHEAVIKAMFDAAFPPGTELGTPLPPPPPLVTPPPPSENALRRFVDTLTLKTRREQRAAEEENARRQAAHAAAIQLLSVQGTPLAVMIERLRSRVDVTPEDLRELAAARAATVRQHFITTAQIEPDRLFLANAGQAAQQSQGAKVLLSLQ